MATKNRTLEVQAVAITATISLIIAVLLFYFFYRLILARRLKRNKLDSSFRREASTAVPRVEFRQHGGTLKGIIVDEEGLDVLYLRKGGHLSGCFSKVWYNPIGEEVTKTNSREDKSRTPDPIQEIPLLQEPSHEHAVKKLVDVTSNPRPITSAPARPEYAHLQQTPPHLPTPPRTPLNELGSSINQTTPRSRSPPPPPPPPTTTTTTTTRLPPPPPLLKKGNTKHAAQLDSKPAPPPPPAKTRGFKPPIPPRDSINRHSRVETNPSSESLKDNGGVQVKLKPLHWEKVTANAEHSMVWNEITDGSFRFDDELIETLFGYTTTTQKSTQKSNKLSSQGSSSSVPPARVFLLEPRKSQNVAIVLKSIAISRKEILAALLEGRGINADILEKLTKICPTHEEIKKILNYSGNPINLADAESFLYDILKAVPSAFIRFNAMLFRTTYDPEILHLKESLQTLEVGCKELRSGRIFFKLLEAILKAGNRMNAGTARGNAQGFNLSALRRLTEVKSTDGKTTLLYFVVEQVIRSEGKRCFINRNHMSKIEGKEGEHNSHTNNCSSGEKDREYLMLGLPVVESLSSEFVNVKKAATVDYDSFISICSILTAKVEEFKQILTRCGDESGGFLKEMKGFLEDCEEELNVVREEQVRVMELVKKTTAYYQAGASKDKGVNPLQLFIVVKDFLNMVNQVCAEIAKKLQKIKVTSAGSSPPLSPTPRSPMRFQNFQNYFMTQKPGSSSSDSEDDF